MSNPFSDISSWYSNNLFLEDPIRKVRSEVLAVARERNVMPIDLAQGNPQGPIDANLIDVLKSLVVAQDLSDITGINDYCSSAGVPEYLNAMASYEKEKSGLNVTADHIVATVGAAGGIALILNALNHVKPGNVLILAPYFPAYAGWIKSNGLEPKVIDYSSNEDETFSRISLALNTQTRALIVNSPNNPMGRIFSENFLQSLGNLFNNFDSSPLIISDQPYRSLVNANVDVPSVAKSANYGPVIEVNSWSKEGRLAGWRIGYLVVNPEWSDAIDVRNALVNRVVPSGLIQANKTIQIALAKCKLPFNLDWAKNFSAMSQTEKELKNIGYRVIHPNGGLFLCVGKVGTDSNILHRKLINEAVGTADCGDFGLNLSEGLVRLSFFDPNVDVNEICNRFRKVF